MSVAAALCALSIGGAALAINDANLSIERLEGPGWSAQGVTLNVELSGIAPRARMTIAQLHSPALTDDLRNVRIDCQGVDVSSDAFACAQAVVLVNWPGLGEQSINARVRYGRRNGALDIAADGVRLAQGAAAAEISLQEHGWRATVDVKQAPIDLVLKLARQFGAPASPVSADNGLVTFSATVHGVNAALQRANVEATIAGLTANNESGTLATDKLSFEFSGEVQRSAHAWQFSAGVRSHRGQAYAQPIFLDLGAHSFAMSASGQINDAQRVTLERFSIDHSGVSQAHGRAVIDLNHEQPLRALGLQLNSLQFPGAYESYFQPLLLDTSFKSMTTTGAIEGEIAIEEGLPQALDLTFSDVSFDDGARNFSLSQLGGRLLWRGEQSASAGDDEQSASLPSTTSRLRWRSGAMLGLELGRAELRFSTQGREFRLLEPARIPVLDGAIELESFRIRNAGTPTVAFLVDAAIQPISVQRLCQAFGWPEFGGRVGGVISKLRMREGVITLGTTLQAQVFDGTVKISQLRLEQPFGQWPRLHSTIALEDLDLELLTGAFSFGRITGRLSGAINELQLFNWTPVAFDARLFTSPGDRSRHRISQRAVQNIGNIGGGGAGVTAALSSGFLRFFDDFNYDRLGLSCRLENEICRMSGVAPAPNGGYYLVKGKGLPRIDVIGNSRRVDWPRLVQQLIAITESEGPVVQ
ncbi:MAG: hypothetical protein ACREV5_19340 [Steroidobacter sp.]